MNWVIETERLGMRKITKDDFKTLCTFLQDIDVMYAWEHAFTDKEVTNWIENNLTRYEKDGFSYFLAIDKELNKAVGVVGPLIEQIDDKAHIGIAYILDKKFWNKGYAYEGAKACMDYAFSQLNANEVIAQIRPNNISSCKIAQKLEMKIIGEYTRYYKDKEMLHLIYSKTKI